MIDLVKNNLDNLEIVCKKHLVKSLYLFGSAVTKEFDPQNSDLDFVVEFHKNVGPLDFADHFFSLLDDLKTIFGMEIDLVSYRALKNEILISEIDNSKIQVYAA